MNENKVNDLIESSLAKVRELTGTETVVGDPIYTPNGTMILPVSKISVGIVNGGLDYSGRKRAKDGAKEYSDGEPHFGGGGGAGISVSPIAFLIISPDGKTELGPLVPSPAARITTEQLLISYTP